MNKYVIHFKNTNDIIAETDNKQYALCIAQSLAAFGGWNTQVSERHQFNNVHHYVVSKGGYEYEVCKSLSEVKEILMADAMSRVVTQPDEEVRALWLEVTSLISSAKSIDEFQVAIDEMGYKVREVEYE